MATLSVQTINRAGIELVAADQPADVAGDKLPNTGNEFIYVHNGGGGGITLTLDIQSTVDGQPVTDRTVSIAAGERKLIGPFPQGTYNDSQGNMNVGYSGVTSVFIAALKLGT